MNETTLQIISILKLLSAVLCASLYAYGGMRGKWKRRFVAPFVLVITLVGVSLWMRTFSWYYLLVLPLLSAALSIGYGADRMSWKIIKRMVYSLACICAVLPLVFINQAWVVFALHCGVVLATTIILGVINPISARAEETVIGMSIFALPYFMIGG